MSNFINYLTNIPSESWHQLWLVLASSSAVAVVLQYFKRWFSLGNRKKLITALLSLLSFVAALTDWIIQGISQNPLLFGRQTATILGVAVVIHRFILSANGLIGWIKQFNADLKAVRQSRQQVVEAPTEARHEFTV